MNARHALQALTAVCGRELHHFWRQRARLLSALVRPTLWLVVFAAGFRNVFGIAVLPPYESYVDYREYVVPGLLGMVLLFNGMQSSLAMVYDREMGMMRLLLTAPLPRPWLLACKLLAGTLLSVAQAYAFLGVCALFEVGIPWAGWWRVLPALLAGGLMLGALGLLLAATIRQLENFAGAMNFVIFPLFFVSSALYPLWKLQESGAMWLSRMAAANPFTHVVELLRYSLYGQFNGVAAAVVCLTTLLVFGAAVLGFDPQRGMALKRQAG